MVVKPGIGLESWQGEWAEEVVRDEAYLCRRMLTSKGLGCNMICSWSVALLLPRDHGHSRASLLRSGDRGRPHSVAGNAILAPSFEPSG